MCGLPTGAFGGLGGFAEDAKKQLDFTLDLKDAVASPPETPDAKQARFSTSPIGCTYVTFLMLDKFCLQYSDLLNGVFAKSLI